MMDENSDVVATDEIESWVSQDPLKKCASVELVSEPDHCQIWMTAIAMGDVNAVNTLKCAHRQQVLAARASERTIFVDQREGSLFRVQARLETFALMTSSSSTLCNSLTCTSNPRPLRCHVPMPTTISSKCLDMLAPPWKVGIRLRFAARSIRLPRRILLCSRHFASNQNVE